LVALEVHAAFRVLLLAAEVVFDRCDGLVLRDVEVVVEVAAVRRVPRERPAPLGLVPLDLVERRARHVRQRRVANVEVVEQTLGHLVGAGRAARASVFPRRIEHEVANDQLPSTLEQVEQAGLAVRSFEHIVLVDLHHG
jgi:hypothetical protein